MSTLRTSFPGYQRRRLLMFKPGLSEDERRELKELDTQLDAFKLQHPDWSAGMEPMRVSIGDLLRAKGAQ